VIAGRLIGRAAAGRHVRDLASAYRVVTLTGPGGIGKTALAVETARGLVADFDDGAWFVELASLSNPDLVPSTVAGALGLKLSSEISAESVARAVGARQFLLVLDNCEHVIDAAADLAEQFTRLCPYTTILATSREVLRIAGEAVYRVPPLDVPAPAHETPDDILGFSAVELFITRTNALHTGFSPHGEEQDDEVLHTTAKDSAGQYPKRPRKITELRGEHRPHQRAGPGNGRKVMSEDHPFIGGNEIAAIVQSLGRSGPLSIEGKHLGGNKLAVEAVSQGVCAEGRNHQPHGVNLLATMKRNRAQRKRTENGNSEPNHDSYRFFHGPFCLADVLSSAVGRILSAYKSARTKPKLRSEYSLKLAANGASARRLAGLG